MSDAGVESLIQIEIARKLYGSGKCYVTLETSQQHLKDWDNFFEDFKMSKELDEGLRFDICVWSKAHKLSGIIEVKRSKESWQQKKDMKRMRRMMIAAHNDENMSLRYTMVAMYLWAENKENLEKLKNKVKKKFDCVNDEVEDENDKISTCFGWHEIEPVAQTDAYQSLAIAFYS